jgi:hypothetical protein
LQGDYLFGESPALPGLAYTVKKLSLMALKLEIK